MAVTLAEYATISNDPLVFGITTSLLKNGSPLNDLPLETKPTLVINGSRVVGNLPSVNWAPLNDSPVSVQTAATPYSERAYIIRNNIDCDMYLVQDSNQIEDPRIFNLRMFLEALRYDINDKFINNNHSTGDVDAPVGLRARLDNPATYAVNSEMKINCNAVDVSLSGITKASALEFMEYLNTALAYMGEEDGNNVVFYMNDVMERRLISIIATMGVAAGFNTQTDAFGRRVTTYRNAKLVNIGRKGDQSTRIITSTETATGASGASVHTSIYGVKYGLDAFCGWQMAPFSALDMGRISGGAIMRIALDWCFGWTMVHTRSICRLYGIKVS